MRRDGIIFTIGYEGRTVEAFAKAIVSAKIELVIDSRRRAGSRKRGFSKTPLSVMLKAHGIEYEHHRELGTPPELMAERRAHGHYNLDAYQTYIEGAPELLAGAAPVVEARSCALL